ncbi:MAG: hypothetical protein JSV04_09100 [Candidatus Heimdallarchaeota archaeon]|nr:MAG: hypothetical protein JSV04_09100 [Candidatus Heimdallarchaeota archaeon]
MRNKFEFDFSICFDSEDQAQIIYASLSPEIQEHRFERSSVSLTLNNQELLILITAQDTNAAKATISSILRWISATTEALKPFLVETMTNK